MIDIKSQIPLSLKMKIKMLFSPSKNEAFTVFKEQKKIIIGLSADYGNLGDVAISYAQYCFLKRNFPDYVIIDMPISKNLIEIKALRSIINDGDIITTVGGGNLTDKYQDIEDLRLMWVKNFPNNKFISFPQTIDFSSTQKGKKSFIRSKNKYEKHDNLHIIARETYSYEIMKTRLSCKSYLCPDIVLSLDKSKPNEKREGILCCIRDDQESILTKKQRSNLLSKIGNIKNKKVTFYDTHIEKSRMVWDERISELDKIWNKFRTAEIIVTDRLHGMIFSVITKTPCVVLINNNHKIHQTYENWLQSLDHISLIKDFNEKHIIQEINRLITIDHKDINLPELTDYYNKLKTIIAL